ncbi:MAG: hypothetical protein O2865_02335 [Planctomycetota bacterium]|nr:hypothetical protein [Planctomycetota bacterium]MDA0933554.1 hypothetical protein [Planctomycetota bacterium]
MTVLELPRPARVRAKILAGICLAAAGCGTPHEESDVRASWEQPADLAVLRVRIPLGSLTVHATEPGSISLSGRARKTARDDAELSRLKDVAFEPSFAATSDSGVYELSFPALPDGVDPGEGAMILRAELYLAPEIAIDVETGRGFLSVRDRQADVRLRSGSGDVELEGVRGTIDVFTGSGGGILHRVAGTVSLETGEGAVLAYIDELGAGGLRLKTGGPSIVAHLPADSAFDLEASVLRSHEGKVGVRNSFGVDVVEERSGHRAVGRVGAGGPTVALEVGTGWISVPVRDSETSK